jgi:hypothetical protein
MTEGIDRALSHSWNRSGLERGFNHAGGQFRPFLRMAWRTTYPFCNWIRILIYVCLVGGVSSGEGFHGPNITRIRWKCMRSLFGPSKSWMAFQYFNGLIPLCSKKCSLDHLPTVLPLLPRTSISSVK